MKKFAAICLLIFALSFPALGGHTFPGNVACGCGTPGCSEDYPGECHNTNRPSTSGDAPGDVTVELGIALVALLFWLRLKA